MVEILNNHKKIILKDLQELEQSICHKYHEIASDLSIQKAELNENSQKLTTAINKHGDDFHKEIDIVIKKLISDLDEMDSKHLAILDKRENEITCTISEIKQCIADLKKLLDSYDVSLVSAYTARNSEI